MISIRVPNVDVVLLFLAIAPSTASKYPDIQSIKTARIGKSKYIKALVLTPIKSAINVTLFALSFNFNKKLAPILIIGSTNFLP